MLAALSSSASIGALPHSKLGSPLSKQNSTGPAPPLQAVLEAAATLEPGAFRRAVLDEALRRDRALIHGIAAYRRHPYHRALPDPPTLWQEGETRLLDYGRGRRRGPKVLFVPSLINRATILDLAEGASMLRWLAAAGLSPLLLDWGWPGAAERTFTLTDYVAGRLERALQAIRGPVVLAGYCMGGLLALAAALRQPARVKALALLATPWDFHTGDDGRAADLGRVLPLLEPMLATWASLPVDILQALFVGLDPFGVAAKYRAFGRLDPESPRARLFVALEDWLNDGIPLAAPVARECLGEWYGANAPARGVWRIAGLPVEPARLEMPVFLAIPGRDRIVPPPSARALGQALPQAVLCEPPAGHIGMVAGSRAEAGLWRPLSRWILGL